MLRTIAQSASEREGNLVETSTIGSKCLEGSLSLFKQVYNKVILLGLGPTGVNKKSVVGIILTGGKIPSESTVRVACEHSIPLILTRCDTFKVLECLESAKPTLKIRDAFKVRQFFKLIEQEMGPSRWVEDLL